MSDNLAVRISSDPALLKLISNLDQPYYHIPNEYEDMIKKLSGMKSTDKGVLVSKVTTTEDLQTQLKLVSAIQHCTDRIHDINTDLYVIQSRWKEMYNSAIKILTLNYFNELDLLKDGVRKTLISVALHPIQSGIDKIDMLIYIGEKTHKHLTATNWNLKMSSEIIQEYLSTFKYGSSNRVAPDMEI